MDKLAVKLALLCGFIVGILVGGVIGHFAFPKTKTEIIKVYDSSKEKAKIDSLNAVILAKESRIEELLDSAKNIKTRVIVKEVNKIKDLPMSENTELLKNNLVKHGELTDSTDVLPTTTVIEEESTDTLAVLSENNVKDVNIIVAKYEGELEINETLLKVISEEDEVINKKDSIISLQSTIMVNQEIGYTNEIKGLEKNLKCEKTKRTIWTAALGAVAATLGIIAISK